MAEDKKNVQDEDKKNEQPKKPDDGREDIFIPRAAKNDDPNLFVSINGRNYLLPRGQKSRVPHEVAAEIRRAWEAEEIRAENEEKLANGEALTSE